MLLNNNTLDGIDASYIGHFALLFPLSFLKIKHFAPSSYTESNKQSGKIFYF